MDGQHRRRHLNASDLLQLFGEVDEQLQRHDSSQHVRVLIVGGAAIALQWGDRYTYDVDIISEGMTPALRAAAARVGERYGLDRAWMNDAAKIKAASTKIGMSPVGLYSGKCLEVLGADARYLLAMKLCSLRDIDRRDLLVLIHQSGITSKEELLDLVQQAYPTRMIPVAVQYSIDETLEEYARITGKGTEL